MRRQHNRPVRRGQSRTKYSYKTQVRLIVFTLLTLALMIALGGIKGMDPKTAHAEALIAPIFEASNLPTPTPTPMPSMSPKTAPQTATTPLEQIVALVKKYFPESPVTALAIFKGESGLNTKSQGWNCYWTAFPWKGGHVIPAKTATSVSWACTPETRHLSWSIDCGLVQNNFPGLKVCPAESFDPEWSLKTARPKYEWRKAIGLTGWEAWTVYNDNRYKNHLEWARKLVEE